MRKQSQAEVAEAARRRLELLGRELDQAGLRRVEEPHQDEAADPGGALPDPVPVPPAGRHVRDPRPGHSRRLAGWVGDQVPETLHGRVGLEAGPVLVVLGLVALAIGATAFVVLRMGGESEPVPTRAAEVTPSLTASPLVPTVSGGAGAPASPGPSETSEVTVDVAGKVRRPGLATLPAGSRVADALEHAGGPRGRVDLSSLNLARVLVDGEQVLVGRAPAGGLAAGASTAAPDATGALVSLNTATLTQLDTLPGVGPVTAQKILDWRSSHGAFSSVDELLEIDGIGEKTLAELAPHVTL